MSATVLPVACRALLGALRRLGLEPHQILLRTGLSLEALEDPDLRISSEDADALWQRAFEAAQDPFLALHAAEATPFGAFRVLDYLAASSSSIGAGLRRVAAYFKLVDPRGLLTVDEGSAIAEIRFEAAQGGPLPPPAQEYTIAILAARLRHLGGILGREVLIAFGFPQPPDPAEHVRFFGALPRYDRAFASISVVRSLWERPPTGADPGLFSALDAHAARLVAQVEDDQSFQHGVRRAIALALEEGPPSLGTIAKKLHLSRRSLQRRLEEDGSSFVELMDQIRKERAMSLLRSREISIAETSWLLGFSEQSAFTRAFKRWTGAAPSEWRRSAPAP